MARLAGSGGSVPGSVRAAADHREGDRAHSERGGPRQCDPGEDARAGVRHGAVGGRGGFRDFGGAGGGPRGARGGGRAGAVGLDRGHDRGRG
ncbi:hypothetical protein E2651_43460, partial [Streptomyces sp. MZ04]